MFDDLKNPAWWFSAVIVAILLNLLSSYLKVYLDRLFSWINSAYRNRSETAKKLYDEEVMSLVQNEAKLVAMAEQEVRLRHRALFYFMFCCFAMLTFCFMYLIRTYAGLTQPLPAGGVEEPNRWVSNFLLGAVLLYFILANSDFTKANTIGTRVKSARAALAMIETEEHKKAVS